jgi:uncharacterized membrane protein
MLQRIVSTTAVLFELGGALVMGVGLFVSLGQAIADRVGGRRAAFRNFQLRMGRAIILGLELLVAADILLTVNLQPKLEQVVVLGIVVLIRIVLSFSLAVELHGRWPWQGHGDEPPPDGHG